MKSSKSASSVATFRSSKYTITTSLTDHAIYIKIVNNISYMCYEGNFDNASFKLPFDIKEIYKFVNRCFANISDEGEGDDDEHEYKENEGYTVNMQLENGTLTLAFEGIVGGLLTVQFDLRLREKLMSNDAQLTINFQRIEQVQLESVNRIDAVIAKMESNFNRTIAEMERRMEALGHADICFTNPPSGQFGYIKSYPIDSKSLTITDQSNSITAESFKKIKYFYKLEQLTLNGCQWCEADKHTSNATVKKLALNASNIFKDISFIQNFPSLVELEMTGFPVDASIVTTLRSVKHTIKKLTFKNCQGINQTEMQTYCTQNGITLNLS